MPTSGKPNTGPVDFFYLLKRRNVSFAEWRLSVGVITKTDFLNKKAEMEAQGEFFFSEEFLALGNRLPEAQESITTTPPTRAPTMPAPAPDAGTKSQETVSERKRPKKRVNS